MSAPAATPGPRQYFVGPFVDFMMMGGLSLACLPLLVQLGENGTRQMSSHIETGVIALWWVVNWPHFSATNYRLYHSRANISQYPITALAIPPLVVAVTIASFLSPAAVAPFFVKLVIIWSVYHFSGQALGLTMIYARRAGVPIGDLERRALLYFLLATFLARVAWDESGTGQRSYFMLQHPRLGIPEWVGSALALGALACAVVFLVRFFRTCMAAKRPVPAIVLLPAICHFIWFVPGWRSDYFAAYVPFFHSLQYMLIAWAMQLKEKMDSDGIAPSRVYVLRESVRWLSINLVGGGVLFFVLPRLCALTGAPLPFAFAVVASAVQLHHFFVDGVIWKLKNPKVSSPLLVHVADLMNAPEPVLVRKAA
jgi:hypothetical protein